jgi:hypothetical protein
MGAVGSGREKLIVDASEQHLLSIDVSEQRCPLIQVRLRDAAGEIRASEFGTICHSMPSRM